MVPLIEHISAGNGVVVQPAPGGLGHNQRVVGDHEVGGLGAANGMLDETAAPMRAG